MAKTAVEQMRVLYNLGVLALENWRDSEISVLYEYGHIEHVGAASRPTDSGTGNYDEFIGKWVDRRIELAEVSDSLGIEDEGHAKHVKEHLDAIYDRELHGRKS